MQILIKQIREHLNISQTELAEQLNVTFATVNRWENGRAVPNKLAQTKLYEICKENVVPVYDITLNRIANAAKDTSLSGGRILLYHGSKSGIVGKIEPKSRSQCDFGKGFYMGTDPSQALTLICDYDKSKFYIVSVDTTDLKTIEVPADIEWAMLVAYHRGRMETIKGTPLYEKYRKMSENKDLVIGSIANDRMFYVIDNFFIGNITDAALVGSLSALQLGNQYVAVTPFALKRRLSCHTWNACSFKKLPKQTEQRAFHWLTIFAGTTAARDCSLTKSLKKRRTEVNHGRTAIKAV